MCSTVLPESRRKVRPAWDAYNSTLHGAELSRSGRSNGLLSDSRLEAAVVFELPRVVRLLLLIPSHNVALVSYLHATHDSLRFFDAVAPPCRISLPFVFQISCSMRTPSYSCTQLQFNPHIGKSQSDHRHLPPACPTIMRSADAWKHQDCNGY